MDIQCPICGGTEVDVKVVEETVASPWGPRVSYDASVIQCGDCGEEAEMAETDRNYLEAKKKSSDESVKHILESLSEQGLSMSYLERAFDLPQRTLARWKTGDYSAAGLALLRTVQACPWLGLVAEGSFKESLIRKAVVVQAANYLSEAVINEGLSMSPAEYNLTSGGTIQVVILNSREPKYIDASPVNSYEIEPECVWNS